VVCGGGWRWVGKAVVRGWWLELSLLRAATTGFSIETMFTGCFSAISLFLEGVEKGKDQFYPAIRTIN
jgi:hypothetical protein